MLRTGAEVPNGPGRMARKLNVRATLNRGPVFAR